ncbi:XkdX family protein [Paenibacillus sp. 19GGS1-52]|nr:XkdX family protein [Paenibacillus sp. 19GGS1-52]ULO09681.1 XkdX family protein [Paenibacillus sp. 19GGS1-52]
MVWFNRIKKFYDAGFWTKDMVADGVVAKKITAEQYEEITGDIYIT